MSSIRKSPATREDSRSVTNTAAVDRAQKVTKAFQAMERSRTQQTKAMLRRIKTSRGLT